jgi:hypothetical protein
VTFIRALLSSLASLAIVSTGFAAELRLLPATTSLVGPHAQQRLIVVAEESGKVIGERTAQATFASSNASVATVDRSGLVKAAGNGETIITATHDGKTTTAVVKVTKSKDEFTWSFRNHVTPLMTKAGCNSGACHGALAGKGGLKLSLRGYAPSVDHFVLTKQALGRRVDRLHPERSLLLSKPTMAVPHGGGQQLEVGTRDYQILADWIASEALGPKSDDVSVQRLEVFPTEAVLKPKDSLQVIVRAWYSDGHSEDVTPWVKFASSEDLVANVDDAGKVSVKGFGEAAITVLYSNLVAATRIVAPQSYAIDGRVFAQAPRQNAIDGFVLKKLETLRIPPSGLCSDHEFIRRACLDAAGILPTPEEVQKFVADKSPDKRSKLIDALLERPEFVDYWAYKWSDVLLVSSRKLPQPAMWSFYRFVRESVAENKPWDRFARDILTANGSSLQNGAVNYFVLHKDVADLTETTSVTFLGMSITCCRCHNHPLEKWTQDQYWEMANLFSRVAIKNGERAGEITIQAQPTGDVPHPRRGIAMAPTPLDGKPLALTSTSDRRAYFADWLTSAENPYFAKALVNRVWRNFLGRGLVEAEDDLRVTNPPSNAELFDYLAADFVKNKHDVKRLIRQIMNSATYQQTAKPLPENAADDRYYSHYLIRRLTAEVILDAYSQATGVATPFDKIYTGVENNVSGTNSYPEGTRALQLPDSRVASRFLDSFGRPDRMQTCACERQQDSSVTQALHLNNGTTLNDKLKSPKSRVETWVKEKISDEEVVRRVFMFGLSRAPTAAEQKKFGDLLAEAAKDPKGSRREALEDLFWAVLTSKEFLFNH